MRRILGSSIVMVSFCSLCSCIRSVNPPIRNVEPILVVEGSVNTGPPPYSIQLSYSGNYTNAYRIPEELFITDANVTIQDDQGDSTNCVWTGNGTYESVDSNFRGVVGRSYRLKVYLSNGKTFISSPETITAVPPIDSVSIVYDSTFITDVRPTQLIISVHAHDPASAQNYYRWTSYGYIPRKSIGGPCGSSPPDCGLLCNCNAFCEQFLENNQINILSDQYINGGEIIQPVFYSPLYWQGKHFIEISQFSISKKIYQFWEQYLAQTNRTGSILDPFPASLLGNVYNQADSNDVALGLFFASDLVTKKIVITPFFLQDYYLISVAGQYILSGSCQDVFRNTLPNDTDPTGWENAQLIDLR